jgi:CheY-like chemotaxis protein
MARTDTPHILLVDDDEQVIRFVKTALERNGYRVTTTTSGKEALGLIWQHVPDLLILDLNMPEPDGFELLKAERASFPYLRILVISGYLHGALLKAAKLLGAHATLQKPFTTEALMVQVRAVLDR